MKKLFLTVTILFGMTIGAFAEWNSYDSGWNLFHLFNFDEEEQEANVGLFEDTELFGMNWNDIFESSNGFVNYEGGGMFGRGRSMNTGVGSGFRNNFGLFLPSNHGLEGDSEAPLGSGIVVLLGMGAAYFVVKKRKEA